MTYTVDTTFRTGRDEIMKKNTILENLTDIDDEFITEVVECQHNIPKKKSWISMLKAASTFLVILVSGVIVAKAADIHINFLEKFSSKKESKYSVIM